MKCPRCQQDNPAEQKFCGECGTPLQLQPVPSQQPTTSAVLPANPSSATDVQPVLGAIARTVARLCEAGDALIYAVDGDRHRLIAKYGRVPQPQQVGDSHPIRRDTPLGLAVLDRRPVHVRDVRADLHGRFKGLQDVRILVSRVRTVLAMPLLREGVALGGIVIRRTRVQPFTAKQVALLKTFADQAAIAIENVRLFNETKEALEQQTATGEILSAISRTQTALEPIFDTIVKNAGRVCDSVDTVLVLADGAEAVVAAHCGPIRGVAGTRFPLSRGQVMGRAIIDAQPVHVDDLSIRPDFPEGQALALEFGHRTTLAVPLLWESRAIGSLLVRRTEVRPFSDKHIAMLQTFADQAVIAIENVRLFTELQARNRDLTEALEQQTATAEILRAISSSPTDVQPVLATVVRSAARLCEAYDAWLGLREGEHLRVRAHHGSIGLGGSEIRPIERGRVATNAILDRRTIHVHDIAASGAEFPLGQNDAVRAGHRTTLGVPLMREGQAIGVILIRRFEVRPFTDSQVALLQTFADQAVIAIENVRLFTELQDKNRAVTEAHTQVSEALERQTATSEILRVISRSPTDVQPVFDAIARNAVALCGGIGAVVLRFDGEVLHVAGHHNVSPDGVARVERAYPRRPGRDYPPGRAFLDRSVIHVPDLQAATEFAASTARQRGAGSQLAVPLLREGEAIGVIGLARDVVGSFPPHQIALLQTFADQAVIAIENVRLFTELQEKNKALTDAHEQVSEALERQTATSEILRVISSSPTSVETVFDTILANALRLCETPTGGVFTFDGRAFHLAAAAHWSDEFLAALREAAIVPGPETPLRRVGITLEVSHVADIFGDPSFSPPAAYRLEGMRTSLAVPMLKEGRLIGALTFHRREVRPFTEAQIALIKIFADQAVIAIENVRLFRELEVRNRDLTEALDRQTATAEVLRVISRSHVDVRPVFGAILDSAVRLCTADLGAICTVESGHVVPVAISPSTPDTWAVIRKHYPRPVDTTSTLGRAVAEARVIHIPDFDDPHAEQALTQVVKGLGLKSQLTVPMIRAGQPIGVLALNRLQPGPFAEAQVELVQAFADQAVIAIENARLLTELQARTQDLTRSVEQLTALGEVGRAVSSTLDVETVLTTIVSRAVALSGLDGGVVSEYDEAREEFIQRAAAQIGGALAEALREVRYRKGEGAIGRTAITREPVQVPDITVPGAYHSRTRENLIESGVKAVLAVPMIHQDRLIGCLGVTRNRPGEFPAETIELLRRFATQSALAIQNARLFREIEDKSRQLEIASQHKSEFLANMSHELRTPLNAIIGFSEVLAERMFGELNDKQEEYLKDIHASGQHLLSLINDILDLSKIEAGRMELELSEFHLPTALDNALTLVRERAGRRGIALHMTTDERLDYVRADERKVRQVVLNLLSNAIKFTPERGRIEVRAKHVDGSVEIAVSDTGIGIEPEDQEAIFEEFRQVGTADKKVEGTGLGLALSRKFVELHRGRIWVESQVGVGSTFTFSIPIQTGA